MWIWWFDQCKLIYLVLPVFCFNMVVTQLSGLLANLWQELGVDHITAGVCWSREHLQMMTIWNKTKAANTQQLGRHPKMAHLPTSQPLSRDMSEPDGFLNDKLVVSRSYYQGHSKKKFLLLIAFKLHSCHSSIQICLPIMLVQAFKLLAQLLNHCINTNNEGSELWSWKY